MPVYLVGAGPGDPELLTVKGQRLLAAADAVLYDALVDPRLLELAPAAAERCYVGKRAGQHALTQEEIGRWMIALARRGLAVVRLKGGDPGVFGRGGEELAALRRAGIACELVPGVTAATAAAAAAGVALTQRGVAPGVRLLFGAGVLAAPPAPTAETLVIYMGLAQLEAIAAALLAQGWPARTRACAVANASLPGERVVGASLRGLAAAARRAELRSPAVVMVGAVAKPARAARRAPAAAEPAGLILLAHGSPLPGGQRGVHRLARELALPGRFCRAAFLPPVEPGLGEVVEAAVAAGVRRLAVVPYFLAPGIHVRRDLPALVAAERRRFPELEMALASCLEGHPALRTAVLARAAAAVQPAPPRRRVSC
ncbi:MAG TPA: uroporphyrinogen-III C-methyltransferase [Terriglobales bacterium]|nr:uroporphyrinogen-III C-methyltransferase [Terriglobales bacterium]